MGNMWPGLIDWLKKMPLKRKYFEKEDLNLLFLAKDYKEVLNIIEEVHGEFKKGKKDFCLNYKKYKF